MEKLPHWHYDEFSQVGRDYSQNEEVDVYDSSHADFRDIQAESNQVLDKLNLPEGATLAELGCGTGTFAIEAAKRGLNVYAVDVSPAMLECARNKASHADIDTIQFHHAGFLTFSPTPASLDAITTTFAFHHLPDFWKGVALERMHTLLKPEGQLYLHDVIIAEGRAIEHITSFIHEQEKAGGDFLREDAEGHFREEFSTYDWVMDGLLERKGFRVEHKSIAQGVLATYYCKRL